MNEYIIPAKYTGQGVGISVMLAGLETAPYEKLELSIDGCDFFEVKRSDDNSSCSCPHVFQQLTPGQIYRVIGRVTVGGDAFVTESMVPAMPQQELPHPKSRTTPQYFGGGMSSPPAPPRAVNH